jgi:hypothetical protein
LCHPDRSLRSGGTPASAPVRWQSRDAKNHRVRLFTLLRGLCVILERSEESRLPKACAEKRSTSKKPFVDLNASRQKRIGRNESKEKTEHRFALREYSGQAPILRLQQLPLRMTQEKRSAVMTQEKRATPFVILSESCCSEESRRTLRRPASATRSSPLSRTSHRRAAGIRGPSTPQTPLGMTQKISDDRIPNSLSLTGRGRRSSSSVG